MDIGFIGYLLYLFGWVIVIACNIGVVWTVLHGAYTDEGSDWSLKLYFWGLVILLIGWLIVRGTHQTTGLL